MLEIDKVLAKDIQMSDSELKLEFAIWLYESDKISLRKAAKLAGLDWEAFSQILIERNIPTVKMSAEEFETTIVTVNHLLK